MQMYAWVLKQYNWMPYIPLRLEVMRGTAQSPRWNNDTKNNIQFSDITSCISVYILSSWSEFGGNSVVKNSTKLAFRFPCR